MGDEFSAIGALADPVRRRLYDYVAAQPDCVGREEAARGAAVPLHSARFHLDELDRAAGALGDQGFEPAQEGSELSLRNCPFDKLARAHTALVCGVNLDFVGGVIEGLECESLDARLEPSPDHCCVRVAQASGS